MARLEEIVLEAEGIGKKWVEANQIARRLRELVKPRLYQIATEISKTAKKSISETALTRMAYASSDYEEFITSVTVAECTAQKLKIEYDALQNLFEAMRSEYSLEKAKMKML